MNQLGCLVEDLKEKLLISQAAGSGGKGELGLQPRRGGGASSSLSSNERHGPHNFLDLLSPDKASSGAAEEEVHSSELEDDLAGRLQNATKMNFPEDVMDLPRTPEELEWHRIQLLNR